MEVIQTLLSDFDPGTLLPELDTMPGKIALLARIVIMAGPVILSVLGLWYLILPPKEANHSVGYRFFWGMSSVESWRFTQKVAGATWAVLGIVLSLIMYVISGGFGKMEMMDILWRCVECIFWEMGLIAVSCLAIDLIVVFTFNSKGIRRREKKVSKNTAAEQVEAEVRKVEKEVKSFVHNVSQKLPQSISLPKKKQMPDLAAETEDTPAEQAVETIAMAEETPAQQEMPVVEETAAEETAAEETAAEEAAPAAEEAAPVAEEAVPEEIQEEAQPAVQEEAQPVEKAQPEEAPAQPETAPAPAQVYAPYQQRKNPYGTKKRYTNGNKKKGKK